MFTEHAITLNIVPGDVPPVAHVSQYDVGREIRITLLDGSKGFELSPDYSYTLVGTKSSGTGFSYDDILEIENNALTFKTTGQMTVADGPVVCGIIIMDGDEHVETLSFILEVHKSALTTDTIIDSDDFHSIIQDEVRAYLERTGILIDRYLRVQGAAADAKATGDALALKVNKPTSNPNGESGQFLRTNGDGTTTWANAAVPTDSQLGEAVQDWLDNHPDATLNIEDGSIMPVKLSDGINALLDEVNNLDENYAAVDFENVDTAWVSTGFARRLLTDQGLISDEDTARGTVRNGYLTGINVVGDSITAGTIDGNNVQMVNIPASQIVGNITRSQIANGSIDLSALTSGVTDEIDSALATAGLARQEIAATNENLSSFESSVTSSISDLQDQIDGAIETWFYSGEPSSSTEPEVNWTTTDEKNNHLGDLYYDGDTGYCYRYQLNNGSYEWHLIADSDISTALAAAAAAQDTADSKRRVFYTTPTPPYDQGDLWVQGSGGDILRCQTPKAAGGVYARSDWVLASKYTDDTVASQAYSIANGKSTAYYQATEPTGGTYTTNDIWFDTDNDNKMYSWNGTQWVERLLDTNALDDGAITAEKIYAGAVTTGKIAAGAVTTNELAAEAVTAAKIKAGEITANEIASNTILGSNIAANTITGTNVQAGSITANEIDTSTLTVSSMSDAGSVVTNTTVKTQYYLSTSANSATGGSWSDTIPSWSSGKYIWTRVATTKTKADSTSSTTYSTAIYDSNLTTALSTANSASTAAQNAQNTANSAAGSVSVKTQYYLSTSSTALSGGSWSDSVPTWASGKYIWTRTATTVTPVSGTATTSYTPSANGAYDSNLTTALMNAATAQSTANGANYREQTIYISKASGTTSVSANTTWVTVATDSQNTWTTKRPTYNSSYPVLFVATQRQTVAQSSGTTCSCTTPVKDDTTTVIDGGHITTGTIDAARIAANSLSLGKLTEDAQEQILNSVVEANIEANNLLVYPYYMQEVRGSPYTAYGITWTVGDDGTITATGTASQTTYFNVEANYNGDYPSGVFKLPAGTYTLSGCPDGGSSTKYRLQINFYNSDGTSAGLSMVTDYGSSATFTIAAEYFIRVDIMIYNGVTVSNLVFCPQIEYGSLAHAWRSPAASLTSKIIQTASEIRTEVSSSSQPINILPSVYYRENDTGNPFTGNGITWTVNPDGSITATGATSDSVATYYVTGANLNVSPPILTLDTTKRYTLSGCPSGGGSSSYRIRARFTAEGLTPSSSTGTLFDDTGSGYTTTAAYKYAYIYIWIAANYTCPSGGITFYPMLEVGDVAHQYVSTHDGTGSLASRVQTTESSLTQQANKIALVVSESSGSNVINTASIVTAINGDSSVTIDADRVNLNGYATFTNADDDVYGENMLLLSDIVSYTTSSNQTLITSSYDTDRTVTYSKKAVANLGFYCNAYARMSASERYTVTFDAKLTSGTCTTLCYYIRSNWYDTVSIEIDGTSHAWTSNNSGIPIDLSDGLWHRFRVYLTTLDSDHMTGTSNYLGDILQFNKAASDGGPFTIEIRRLRWGKMGATVIDGSHITTGQIDVDRVNLYGNLNVYSDDTAQTVGGNMGFMKGSVGFLDGTSADTDGMAISDPKGENYLIVTGNYQGGKNILTGTNTDTLVAAASATNALKGWRTAGDNTGTRTSVAYSSSDDTLDDPPFTGITHGWLITDTTMSGTSYSTACCIAQNYVPITAGTEYTMSCYARLVNASDTTAKVHMFYGISQFAPTDGSAKFSVTSTEWQQYTSTFTADGSSTNIINASGQTHVFFGVYNSTYGVEIAGMKLEEGDTATEWGDQYYIANGGVRMTTRYWHQDDDGNLVYNEDGKEPKAYLSGNNFRISNAALRCGSAYFNYIYDPNQNYTIIRPWVIWDNASPTSAVSAQTIPPSSPSGTWTQDDIDAMSANIKKFSFFFIGIRRTTSDTSSNGALVYCPSNSSVNARPTVSGVYNSRLDEVYRGFTINRSAGTITWTTGYSAGVGYDVEPSESYAIPVTILAFNPQNRS